MATIRTEKSEEVSGFSPSEGKPDIRFKPTDSSLEKGGIRKSIDPELLQKAVTEGQGVSKVEPQDISLETDKPVTNIETQQLITDLKLTGEPDKDLSRIMDSNSNNYAGITDLANDEMFNRPDDLS